MTLGVRREEFEGEADAMMQDGGSLVETVNLDQHYDLIELVANSKAEILFLRGEQNVQTDLLCSTEFEKTIKRTAKAISAVTFAWSHEKYTSFGFLLISSTLINQ